MNPADVERLFQEALDLPAGARRAHVSQAAGTNEALRNAVEHLLDSLEIADRGNSWELSALDQIRPASLGRYRLLERIGAGGMAVVFKAVRADDEFSKLVAIKILLQSDLHLIERFRRERQMLAGLEHPNIARLIDGGTADDGSPFLVMEYVEGIPVDQYGTLQHLDTRATLDLFAKICSAVAYAHRNLIVHRDLKPGNILVDSDGEPKLLDFGISKLLDGTSERTKTGLAAMTPEYASPEQVSGGAMTTATDVYSLGVVLYELLTGMRPYAETANALDLADAIVNRVAPALPARFDRELDLILQMAMAKEPRRRYASVEQFADDLRLYVDGYPILARRPTRIYTLRKFAGRNKLAILAAATVLLVLSGGIFATMRQARIATQRFNDVRRLAHSVLFDYHDAIAELPGSVAVRQRLVKDGLDYLDRLSQQAGSDRDLLLELAAAYVKVGDVQAQPLHANLGDTAGGLESYRKAVAILESLHLRLPTNEELQEELAFAYDRFGKLSGVAGSSRAGFEYQQKAVTIFEKLCATGRYQSLAKLAENRDRRVLLAEHYVAVGRAAGAPAIVSLGNTAAAESWFRKALAIYESLPSGLVPPMNLSVLRSELGGILTNAGKSREALAEYKKALEIDEEIGKKQTDVTTRYEVAIAHHNFAVGLLSTKDYEQALEHLNAAGAVLQSLADADPNDTNIRIPLADNTRRTAEALYRLDRDSEAVAAFRKTIALYESLSAKTPNNTSLRLRTGTAYLLESLFYESRKNGAATVDAARHSADKLEPIAGEGGVPRQLLARTYYQTGRGYTLSNDWKRAREWFQRSATLWDQIKADGQLAGSNAGRPKQAAEALAESQKHLR